MSKKNKTKLPPLEDGLVKAMNALDNQIARAMQKDVTTKESEGIKKYENYRVKVEEVTGLLLNSFGADKIGFDSFLILSQSLIKALYIMAEDLGESGLGKVRSEYLLSTVKNIERDLKELRAEFSSGEFLN